MFKTLIVAGIAAFVGKKLYDKGKLDPYIAEARKQLKIAFPDTGSASAPDAAGSEPKPGGPSPFAPPPHGVPVS